MQTVILIFHVLAAAGIIGTVLLQHGKGADMGAAFGSGSAGSLFGASGSANFLSRTTGILAAVFFVTSLGLTYLSTGQSEGKGVMISAPPAADAAVTTKPVDQPESGGKLKDIPK
jgi:preprotein translocase subunit SecG